MNRIALKQPARDQAEQALIDYLAKGRKVEVVPAGIQTIPAYISRKEVNEAQWRRRQVRERERNQ